MRFNSNSDLSNHIVLHMYCARCIAEKPPNISHADFARIEVGVTSPNPNEASVQVWCGRHNINMVLITESGATNAEVQAHKDHDPQRSN